MSARRTMAALGVLVLAALALTACGFRPLYGEQAMGGGAGAAFASVSIAPIEGRAGWEVRNALIDRLSPRGQRIAAPYRLEITLDEDREGLAVRRDAAITRFNYRLTATWTLIETATSRVLHRETVVTRAGYDVVQAQFGTLAAQRDAEQRAAIEMAEQIRLQLGIVLAEGGRVQ